MFFFGAFTLLTLLVAVPIQILVLPWDPHRRAAARVAHLLWGVALFRVQPLWRLTITGLERLEGGPFIVVANHRTMLDIPLLLTLPVPLRVVARPGVFAIPVFGQMARFGRHVELDAADPASVERALAACRAWLERGVSVVLFPEGHRSRTGDLLPFQRGAFELALRCGVDVLPVALVGTADVQPMGGVVPTRTVVHLRAGVLEPLRTEGQGRRALAKLAQARVEAALKGPQPWEIADRVFARYRPQGRFRAGWARGKVSMDPVFWMLRERLPDEGRLLDAGCGEGLLAAYLHEGGGRWEVHGLDVDPARVAAAEAAGLPGARFEIADLAADHALPEADAITCIDVLHYLRPDLQDRLIARLCAALRPGGLLLLRDPERGAGLRGLWTRGSERALVAVGRHKGRGVWARGSETLARQLQLRLEDVKIERASRGPFANALISGRRAAR